jgi:hypothetical protein
MARLMRMGDARRGKPHDVYMPDDLFERIMVQALRRDVPISEYLTAILEAAVPDHLDTCPTVWVSDTPLGRATLELDRGRGWGPDAFLELARAVVAELEAEGDSSAVAA